LNPPLSQHSEHQEPQGQQTIVPPPGFGGNVRHVGGG
jgi:hypothetical protein